MQTRTYGDLFSLITNMIGAVELAADEQTQVKNFINRRFQEAFDTSPIWPRYVVTGEERDFTTDTQIIPYVEGGKDTIGEFIRIHNRQPFLNLSALEYEFYVDANGANILNIRNTTDSSAFVTYKKQFTPFSVTSDFYNSTADVPAEFFNFLAHTVYADFLRVQNKQEEAIAEENVAAKYLAQELEKVDIRMNNSTVNKRFNTYVNRQSR